MITTKEQLEANKSFVEEVRKSYLIGQESRQKEVDNLLEKNIKLEYLVGLPKVCSKCNNVVF